jgi:hypothetical protein
MGGGDEHEVGDGPKGWDDEAAGASHAPFSPHEHERLDLDDGARLPWLESDDEEYIETVSTGRVVLAAVLGLLVLGAVIGGLWWYTHHQAAGQPVADGSTVAAPPGPYKDAPKNPGGKTYQGTGDTSYVVSQGHDRQAQLADNGDGGMASANGSGVGASAGSGFGSGRGDAGKAGVGGAQQGNGGKLVRTDSGAADAGAAPAGGVAQIGAFSTQALAEAAWSRLSSQHTTLANLHHRVVQGQADIGTVWRLQVITGAGGGNALCDRLRGEGLPCQVKR